MLVRVCSSKVKCSEPAIRANRGRMLPKISTSKSKFREVISYLFAQWVELGTFSLGLTMITLMIPHAIEKIEHPITNGYAKED
jgi:hypothetical protein